MTRRTWNINSTLTEVARAAAEAEALCKALGAEEAQALRIGLALDELTSNALVHGAEAEETAQISATVWDEGEHLHLEVEATGPGFDPRKGKPQADPYALGGRGLALVLAFADELSYQRRGARNVTRFTVSKFGASDDD